MHLVKNEVSALVTPNIDNENSKLFLPHCAIQRHLIRIWLLNCLPIIKSQKPMRIRPNENELFLFFTPYMGSGSGSM